MRITLEKNGLKKTVKTGFSWKHLFFGVFYTLYKGDTNGAIKQLIISCATFGVALLFFPFTYNKAHLKRLIQDGWKPATEAGKTYCQLKIGYQN